ncbi:MAG TPA: ABC transporter permease [Terriglobales bacterium]|nr:ABC transporter permease [Terriglobales bacterium]
MPRISSLLRNLLGRQRAERDLHDEVGGYVEMLAQENQAAGMAPGEARRRALIAAGGIEQVKEGVRAVRAGALLEQFWQDLRYGARMLAKNPGFALVAVLTIALGIGVNAGIFAIVDSATLRPLEVPNAKRVVGIYQLFFGKVRRNVHGSGSMFSYPEYLEYRDRNHVLSGVTAFQPFVEATLSGYPQQLTGSLATCNYFEVLQAPIALGRGFLPAECAAEGAGPVVVLSDALWRGAFGADPQIIGKTVRLNRQPLTVVGVAGSSFHGTEVIADDFWAPVTLQNSLAPSRIEGDLLRNDNLSWLVMLGRLRDGISVRQAQSDLEVIAGQIDQRYPGRTTRLIVTVATYFTEPEMNKISTAVSTIVLIAVGMVLLIACANVANLMLARAVKRRREIAVRLAIGAARGRVVRQMLTESLLLALIGGGLGLLMAAWSSGAALRLMLANLPPGAPPFAVHVQPDARLFLYALLLTIATAVVFGLAPALQATRGDVNRDLKVDAGASERGAGHGRMRGVLIAAQVAVCMVLLIGAGLLLRGLYRAQTLDTGFDNNHTALVSFDLRGGGYDPARAAAFHRDVRERLRRLPGVDAVASAMMTPLNGSRSNEGFKLEGDKDLRSFDFNAVSPEYFSVVGIPLVRGRTFLETEKDDQAAIVSEAAARKLWPGQEALGKRICAERPKGGCSNWMAVVGVARNADTVRPGSAEVPIIYLPLSPQDEVRAEVLVHSKAGYAAIAPAIPGVLHQLDADLLVRVTKLEDNLKNFISPSQIAAGLAATFGGLALLLAAIGIYGTVSYNVGRRTREIGIRMTLGAQPGNIQGMVLRQAMRPVVIGAVIGSALCAVVSQVLSVLLFGVSPLDPVAFSAVAAFLLLVAAAASFVPTRRAVQVDPMVALRQE